MLGVVAGQEGSRPRARDVGLAPGVFAPGPLNAITDVAGVLVGHLSLNQGDRTRTGVTVVVPHGGNVFQEKVAGAVFVGNAFGKLAGSTQVDELGTIETPIALTNTLAVGAAIEGLVLWTLARPGNAEVRSVNALVGETNDGGSERHPHAGSAARARDRGTQGRAERSGGGGQRRGGHGDAEPSGGKAGSARPRVTCPRASAATPSASSSRATSAACSRWTARR